MVKPKLRPGSQPSKTPSQRCYNVSQYKMMEVRDIRLEEMGLKWIVGSKVWWNSMSCQNVIIGIFIRYLQPYKGKDLLEALPLYDFC